MVKKTNQNVIGKGKPGPGRPKGTVNKRTALLKDSILQAAAEAHEGGMVGYLTEQAKDNPTAFLTLLGKVLPMDVTSGGEKIAMPTTILLEAAIDSRAD